VALVAVVVVLSLSDALAELDFFGDSSIQLENVLILLLIIMSLNHLLFKWFIFSAEAI
jgi:hypothetical protein